ncbi:CHAT domain-containing protein, partial [Marinilabilia sp.]
GTELELLNDMALLMLKWSKTNKARHYTSQADSIARSYEKDFFKSPHANNIQFVLNHIFKSSRIHSDLFLREGKIRDYEQAQKLFLEGLKLTNRLNFNLIDKSSLAYLSNNIKKYLPWYFDINYMRYQNTGDEKYAGFIGDALANNKARTLTTLIRKEENRKLTASNEDIQKVDSLEYLINDLESAILSSNDKSVADSLKIKRVETAIDLLGYKFREERQRVAHDPVYAENTSKKIQKKLDAKSIFIDYYLSDSVIYTTYITNQKIDIKRQNLPSDFSKAVRYKQRSLKTGTGKTSYEDILWSALLDPLNAELKNKKSIIIVPDSYLYEIPFETLFKNDQFLIESHTINYNYSALAYLLSGQKVRPQTITSLILAPDFTTGNDAPRLAFRSAENDSTLFRNGKLVSLPFAQSEAKEIFEKFRKKDVSSNLLTGSLATKENFIKHATQSHILHMATHGYSSSENPFRSCIFFSGGQNEEADYMMMNELYNLSLNADLAVLSACQTGNGQIIEGEGMLALPGGFIFSGVPNVIASLWKVHDEKTRFLMEAFYQHLLEKNESYKQALRLAKMDCIKEGYLPLDWAGFVLIGE